MKLNSIFLNFSHLNQSIKPCVCQSALCLFQTTALCPFQSLLKPEEAVFEPKAQRLTEETATAILRSMIGKHLFVSILLLRRLPSLSDCSL